VREEFIMGKSFEEVMERYLKESEADFNLDAADLEAKLRQIPNLHSKWLRYFYRESHRLLKKEKDLKICWRDKLNYYLYHYEYEVKHTQVKFYIESDEEYSKIYYQVTCLEKLVEMIESILKKTTQLSFDLNNLIKFKELKAGK
jgi:CRISPR/Cas system CSM-associated protein Csm2 small subunit